MWHGVITELDDIDWESIFPNNFTVKNEILETYKELAPWYSELVKPKTKEISSLFTTPFFNHSNTNLLDKDLYIMSEPLRTHSIFRELKEKKLINLYENCVAIELQDCDGNNKKTKLLKYFHDGDIKELYGDIFIVSCGALETPRLILQSHESNNFSCNKEYIGSNLIDHPWTVVGEISSTRPILTNHFSIDSNKLNYRRGHNILIKDDLGTKNHCVMYRPYQFGNINKIKNILTKLIISRSLKTWIKLFRQFNLLDILSTVIYMISEKYNLTFLNFKCAIYIYMDQKSSFKSRLSLSGEKDSFGRNIPVINWYHGQEEQEDIKKVDAILKEELRKNVFFKYSSKKDLWKELSSGSHHAGTMKIDLNRKGVIDENLKMHDKENVFICDLSIFPRFGNSNPTYTLSAFSLRLGKYLFKNYS